MSSCRGRNAGPPSLIRKLPANSGLRADGDALLRRVCLVSLCYGECGRFEGLLGVEMPKLDEYLTMRAAAEYLGVCRNTLRNWEVAGKIPIRWHPLNNHRLFKVSDLGRLLQTTERSVSI